MPAPKRGDEPFNSDKQNLGFTVNDFWRWNGSDLLNNLTRGHLAEFIVAKALRVKEVVREAWATYDLKTPSGTTVEVKSAAYLQSWKQDDYSSIQFSVRKTKELDMVNGGYREPAKRHANVYVFALLSHKKVDAIKDKKTVNPLELNQWEFYVLPTEVLNELDKNSITLKSLQDVTKLTKGVSYSQLEKSVQRAFPAP